jgi:hypothetical protein
MIRFLQEELPKLWTDEFYSKEFLASNPEYRDFEHAILHLTKTLGKLATFVEEADHRGAGQHSGDFFPKNYVEKYLADIVIVAIRMAIKNPTGAIDLERAIFDRIEKKMGVKLSEG